MILDNRLFKVQSSQVMLFLLACLYVVIPSYFVYQLLGRPLTGIDDAVIFFTYARHFADGHGVVYNIGGEHVEGFTSWLYFFVCSGFYAISRHPEKLLFAYNGLIVIATSYLMLNMLKRLADASSQPSSHRHMMYLTYLMWLVLSPFYFNWAVVSLMDVATYGFVLVASYCYFVFMALSPQVHSKRQQSVMVSGFIGLMLLCRPEGMLWGLVYIVLFGFLSYITEKNVLRACVRLIMPAASYSVVLGLLTVFRLSYFGYPLPNTYYAKVSSSLSSTLTDGAQYFLDYVDLHGVLLFLPVLLLTILFFADLFAKKGQSLYQHAVLVTLLFVGASWLIPVVEGGDHFNGFRLYQAAYPILVMPCIFLLVARLGRINFKSMFVMLCVFMGALAYFDHASWIEFKYSNPPFMNTPHDNRMRAAIEYDVAQRAIDNATHLNLVFQHELPSIGYEAAGGIAYGYDGFVYDLMGLNDIKMAHAQALKEGGYKGHQSFNKTVFFEQAPDILKPSTVAETERVNLVAIHDYYTSDGAWDNLLFKNIFNDPEFIAHYTLALVKNERNPAYQCYGYFNRDYLNKLSQSRHFDIQTYPS